MKYEEKKQMIEAMNTINGLCKKYGKGSGKCDCINVCGEDGCALMFVAPCHWNIPKLSRWTPEDVMLAKALKAAGVTYIHRERDEGIIMFDADERIVGMLYNGFFKNAIEYEEIVIDTIIEEAEEK